MELDFFCLPRSAETVALELLGHNEVFSFP